MQNSMNKSHEKSENIVEIHSNVFTNAIKAMSGEAKSFTPQTLLDMSKTCIIKKDGTLEEFNIQKIVNAVTKSAQRVLIKFTKEQEQKICAFVEQEVKALGKKNIDILEIHNIVESALDNVNPKVAQSYRNYRNYKTDFVSMLDKVYQESQRIMYIGDKENANADSTLVSTKRSLIFNELNK